MGYRYGWDTVATGLLLMGVGVCSILVQGVLVGPVVRALGERRTMLVGLAGGMIGFVIQALASDGTVYVIGIVVMSLWGLLGPALQGVMTRLVSPSEQGQLQGANSSVLGIASLFGPLLFTQIFASFIVEHRSWNFPGAPFLLSALLLVAALVVALRTMATRLKGQVDGMADSRAAPLSTAALTDPD